MQFSHLLICRSIVDDVVGQRDCVGAIIHNEPPRAI